MISLEQQHELDEQGYTVIPGFRDPKTTQAIRELTDELAGPVRPTADAPSASAIRCHRHPIHAPLLSELANDPKTLALAEALIRTDDLRMLEQVLIRTDPSGDPSPPRGWHIDMPFSREEYESTPRHVYFHMVTYCAPVESGQAAFTIVPGTHDSVYKAIPDRMSDEERVELRKSLVESLAIDTSERVEVCGDEGDLVIFNPSCLHSASFNRTQQPRYVYFTSFYSPKADGLCRWVENSEYRSCIPDSLRAGMHEANKHLLD